MKKSSFIITETIFSLVLAASVAAVAVLAVDLNTDQFQLDRFNPFSQESSAADEEEITPPKNNEQNNNEENSESKSLMRKKAAVRSHLKRAERKARPRKMRIRSG